MSRREQIAEAAKTARYTAAEARDIADALLPTIDRLCAEAAAEALEQAAVAVEELRPHIPPSTDPDRRTRVVQRSSFNRAASAVRARAAAVNPSKEQQP